MTQGSLFDNPPPPQPSTEAPKSYVPPPTTERSPPPPRLAFEADCLRPFIGSHRCRIGGGDACYSDDNGKTWFCSGHRPGDFLPADRA